MCQNPLTATSIDVLVA